MKFKLQIIIQPDSKLDIKLKISSKIYFKSLFLFLSGPLKYLELYFIFQHFTLVSYW